MKLQLRLNANHLKLAAIIAMTIDHVCDLIYPGFPAEPRAIAFHIVGRLTAPIMWFFVCEGYHYTHNAKRYMLRMGVLLSFHILPIVLPLESIPFHSAREFLIRQVSCTRFLLRFWSCGCRDMICQ